MIKKSIIISLLFLMFCPVLVLADDDWSNFSNVDNAWDGQKSITNKQFEETMDALQANKKRKEAKQRAKLLRKFKGSSLTPQMDANNDSMVNENPEDTIDESQLINIPVDFVVDGKSVERGFYKIIGERKPDGVYILLYQAHSLKAKIKARETDDDFNQDAILFAKLLPFSDHQMKIIYGCVEFNAVAYINFIEPESLF